MNVAQNDCAQYCLDAAESNAMTFPDIVGKVSVRARGVISGVD